MSDMHALIFAYGSNPAIREITTQRAIGSIPYGGRYRIIDFILSNLVNAGITDIGVIMRENYQSMLDHLGSGKDWDLNRKRGGLKLLPPFALTNGAGRNDGYRGHMEALSSVYSYVHKIREKYTVLADEDIVANIDLDEVLEKHIQSGASITAVSVKGNAKSAYDPELNTYFKLNADGFVSDVVVNPKEEGDVMALGLYILETELLWRLINHCQAHKLFSFNEDVLQKMCGSLKIYAYLVEGYAVKIQSIAAFFRENMRLLEQEVRKDLFPQDRLVKTKVRDDTSTYYSPESRVKNSLIADGCYIEGELENCIVFRGVRVEKDTKISNSILMQDTVVSAGAVLNYAITDKEVFINKDRKLMGHETYPITIAKGSVV